MPQKRILYIIGAVALVALSGGVWTGYLAPQAAFALAIHKKIFHHSWSSSVAFLPDYGREALARHLAQAFAHF